MTTPSRLDWPCVGMCLGAGISAAYYDWGWVALLCGLSAGALAVMAFNIRMPWWPKI